MTSIDWTCEIVRAQYAIGNAGLRSWPYPHIVLAKGALALAGTLCAHLPDDSVYRPLSDLGRVPPGAYAARRVVTPEMAGNGDWPEAAFWRAAFAAFASADLAEMILQIFDPIIRARLPHSANGIEADLLLVRDGDGYKIGPHTDSPRRLVSCLFYLGDEKDEASVAAWGTTIYVPVQRSYRCRGGPHHGFENFHHVATAPFVLGGGVIFAKTDNSFHGVEPIAVASGRHRDLLLLDYRLKQ